MAEKLDLSKLKNRDTDGTKALLNMIEKTNGTIERAVDETIWKLVADKDGEGRALIRFLYKIDADQVFIETRNHAFKDKGGWLIEPCPKTHGFKKACPICEYSDILKRGRIWKDIPRNEQDAMRKFFSRKRYWANIYVIKDPNNPENEGKVFKFSFGTKILQKIDEVIRGNVLTGEKGYNPFNPFTGATFELNMRRIGDFPNYDASRFLPPSALFDGDEEKIEEVMSQTYDLRDVEDYKSIKSYDSLKERFNKVMGFAKEEEEEKEKSVPVEKQPIPETKPEPKEDVTKQESDLDEDYFKKLVDDI